MKTLIFDFDGTLADTLAINHQILNRLAGIFRFRQTDEAELKALKRLPAKQILQALEITPLKAPLVMAAGKFQLAKHINDIPMPDGLLAQLHGWRQDYRLGVVSTNGRGNINRFLRAHNAPSFDFIYANARLLSKSQSIARAIAKQGLSVADCVYIGDEIRDVEAARTIGMKCICVTWGYNTKAVLAQAKPDGLADTVEELAASVALNT